jgi:Na+/proline symporter
MPFSYIITLIPDTQGDLNISAWRTTLPLFYVRLIMYSRCIKRSRRHFRLAIGLFGLVGMLGVAVGPFIGRLVDHLVPWYATLIATVCQLIFQGVQTGAGGINIAAVIISCFGLDVGRQMQQVSLTSSVFT